MILDTLENSSTYEGLHPLFKKGFDFLKNTDLASLSLGKHSIEGDDLFAVVQEYTPKALEEKDFEIHQKYIDIQFILGGHELMGYAPLENLSPLGEFDQEADCQMFAKAEMTPLKVKEGSFAIFFAKEAHMPGCQDSDDPCQKVKKIILKVKQ